MDVTADEGERWFWGRQAPDEWFTDRSAASVMVRGYLALRVEVPESAEVLAAWSGHFQRSRVLVSWMRGSLEVPPPIGFRYVGGGRVVAQQDTEAARLPPGIYVVLMVPVLARYREVDGETERDALARLDSAAGLLAAIVSANATYQEAFEFLAEAGGPGTRVMSPVVRRPEGPVVQLNEDTFHSLAEAMRAIADASETVRARASTSLRWYGHAQTERNRPDAFVKFWIALEALAFNGNGRPGPLVELLARSYERDARWVRETFAIDALAQLRNDVVHSGQRPMLHGNLLRFVDALYVDALRARLNLPNTRNAERALPGGRPLRTGRWRNAGEIATAFLPVVPTGGSETGAESES